MTFAVQRYRNNFSKIYELFLKDIGMKNQTGKEIGSKVNGSRLRLQDGMAVSLTSRLRSGMTDHFAVYCLSLK